MSECMYVCLHVCMSVYMYVCMYVSLSIYVCVYTVKEIVYLQCGAIFTFKLLRIYGTTKLICWKTLIIIGMLICFCSKQSITPPTCSNFGFVTIATSAHSCMFICSNICTRIFECIFMLTYLIVRMSQHNLKLNTYCLRGH